MGVDDSKERNFGDATRTDALILATFNVNDKSVKMVSIPRDSYVYIPERRKKIRLLMPMLLVVQKRRSKQSKNFLISL